MKHSKLLSKLGNSLLLLAILSLIAGCAPIMPMGDGTPSDAAMDHGAVGHGDMAADDMPADDMATDNMGIDDMPFDAMFIDGMIEHHVGAVTMAEQVLAESERAELLTLAEAIVATQSEEIDMMNAWRDEWYPDLPPSTGMAMEMGDMEIADDPSKTFDQRFLETMISHHEGAIDMAVMAQQMAEHEEVRAMADDVIVVQQAEIEQMQRWLVEWFGVDVSTDTGAETSDE